LVVAVEVVVVPIHLLAVAVAAVAVLAPYGSNFLLHLMRMQLALVAPVALLVQAATPEPLAA
jgi:hypothetical protein